MMEGENLMWVSHDSVFVLQHAGDPIPLRSAFVLLFMSSRTSVLLSLSKWPSLHKLCMGKNQIINVGGYWQEVWCCQCCVRNRKEGGNSKLSSAPYCCWVGSCCRWLSGTLWNSFTHSWPPCSWLAVGIWSSTLWPILQYFQCQPAVAWYCPGILSIINYLALCFVLSC